VVIAIIAILAVVMVLTLNPAEMLRQSRDANRVSDTATITSALNLYTTDQSGASSFSLGNASDTYISAYDPSATSTAGDQCQGLGMMPLNTSTGQAWQCSPSSTYRNVNNTGWISVNLNKISAGPPIGNLPVDPTNQTSSGLFYSYNTNGNQFEVTAELESQKYKGQFGQTPNTSLFPEVVSGGTPTVSSLYNPSGLVGYWPLNEGSGTVAHDQSGNGDNAITNGSWLAPGKVGSAALILASGTSIAYSIGSPSTVLPSTAITISAWINATSFANYSNYFQDSNWWSVNGSWDLYSYGGGGADFGIYNSGVEYDGTCSSISAGQWHLLTGTYDGHASRLFLDGSQCATITSLNGQSLDRTPITISSAPAPGTTQSLNDVRIYNRALSPAEIQALYTAEH